LSQVCGTNPKESISRLVGNCTTAKRIVRKVCTSLLEARFSRERVHISAARFSRKIVAWEIKILLSVR